MRSKKYILTALCFLLLLTGCGTKKHAVETVQEETPSEPEVPAWHTCLIQGARASVFINGSRTASTVTMQTVRDSMLVISVMPLMGIEMMRLEATPLEFTAIDKMHAQYANATYAELNRKLTPNMNWDILQQLCTGELPTGDERARLQYTFGDDVIEIVVDYPKRQLDVPVRVGNQNLTRYMKIDISRWL